MFTISHCGHNDSNFIGSLLCVTHIQTHTDSPTHSLSLNQSITFTLTEGEPMISQGVHDTIYCLVLQITTPLLHSLLLSLSLSLSLSFILTTASKSILLNWARLSGFSRMSPT